MAFPLILSSSGMIIMQFVDGMFLAAHSPADVAAAGSSGCMSWLLTSLIIGTVGYTTIITANMIGAKLDRKVGPAIWQGIYLAIIGGILAFIISFYSESFFKFCGHEQDLAHREGVYMQIILAGTIANSLQTAISGFFSGRGDNVRLMFAQVSGQIVNIVGDYILIFGKFGFPELGIAGAAIATVFSAFVPAVILFFMMLAPWHKRQYNTARGWRINLSLMKDLIHFGFPSGIQSFIDAALWTFFLILVGRIGTYELAATSIAFRLNSLALHPVIGIGRAEATFVGQCHGKRNHHGSLEYTGHGVVMGYIWMSLIAMTYLIFPKEYYGLFISKSAEDAELIIKLGTNILRFVALYCLADSLNVTLASMLQAVGDTKYMTYVMGFMSLGLSILLFFADRWHFGLYVIWSLATAYVISFPPFWYHRIKGGTWKNIQVVK